MGHGRRDRARWGDDDREPWLRGGIIGFAAMLVVFGVATALTGGPVDPLPAITGVLMAAALFGAVPVSMVVLAVGAFRRRRSEPRWTDATVEDKIQHVKERIQRPDDAWERLLQRCEQSVRATGDAVALAPASPATDWLASMHGRMEQELDKAVILARLARTAFPDEWGTLSAAARAHPLHERLRKAVADFETSKQSIVDIVARLVREPHLDDVRSELAMLEIQLPVLSEPDFG